MKIIQEGETGYALAPDRGRVPVVFEYRDLTLDSGVRVRDVLVGVDRDSGEILVVPAQSTPRIKESREASKEAVLQARVPRELEDVLALLAQHFDATPKKFTPALIRFYLRTATSSLPLARRLGRLSEARLARGQRTARVRIRCRADLSADVDRLAATLGGSTQSDLIRGAILAAKEDVLDGRAARRAEKLEAVAAAV